MQRAGERSSNSTESTSTWIPDNPAQNRPDWRTVDGELRRIASRRAALDAEEAHWLRQAEALQIWRPLGMVSALDYLERVLGYAPRTAQDRLRVARALGDLPQLTAALATGKLAFSAIRELTRVATPRTEAVWVAAATGKNLRQIEDLVADHHPGDRPDDPPDPQARTHVVRFELTAETFALVRQTRTVLDDEHGMNLPDDAFVAALCSSVLNAAPTTEPNGRAKFQVALTVCERCRKGWQEGAGAQIPISPAAVERAMCDAQHIGSIAGDTPERAAQDIPPSTVRFVWRRDGGRCRVPGCRSARGLEVHHIIHRADGGGHDPSLLVLLCSACHQAHHAGVLAISGTADRLDVRRPGEGSALFTPTDAHVGVAIQPITATDVRVGAANGLTTSTDAHVGAANGLTTSTDAHVGAANGLTTSMDTRVGAAINPIPTTNAHVGATNRSTTTNAHLGAVSQAITTNDVGAAIDPTPTTNAHVGAAIRTNGPVRLTSKLDLAILRTQAKAALTGLGWKPAIAHAAVTAASAVQRPALTLEELIRESLRRCPVPRA